VLCATTMANNLVEKEEKIIKATELFGRYREFA
jgi:hypothetical protein